MAPFLEAEPFRGAVAFQEVEPFRGAVAFQEVGTFQVVEPYLGAEPFQDGGRFPYHLERACPEEDPFELFVEIELKQWDSRHGTTVYGTLLPVISCWVSAEVRAPANEMLHFFVTPSGRSLSNYLFSIFSVALSPILSIQFWLDGQRSDGRADGEAGCAIARLTVCPYTKIIAQFSIFLRILDFTSQFTYSCT